MSSLFSIGLMNQLADTLENAGFTAEDLTKFRQFGNLKGIKDILYGYACIEYPEYLIDCDADPPTPNGWLVEEHKQGGVLLSLPDIDFYLSEKQIKGTIGWHDLRAELSGQQVMNANILHYLLAHQELIPKIWRGKSIFFWGTIYRDPSGDLRVPYLRWCGPEWSSDCAWIRSNFGSDNPAAVLKL